MSKYIILRNSVQQAAYIVQSEPRTETGKQFKVVQGGFVPTSIKAQSLETTLNGKLDISQGSVRKVIGYSIFVPEVSTGNNGILLDLQTLYNLNNPNGSPSTLIHLVDHYEDEYDGFLLGNQIPQALTTVLRGASAYYIVPIEFGVRDPIA